MGESLVQPAHHLCRSRRQAARRPGALEPRHPPFPRGISPAAGKGEQSPRAAVVCFDAERFTQSGASEAAAAAARNLHDRLSEISNTLGINFPVYVLFTRMDRLPYFREYVRNLSAEEATQVLGATLPLSPVQAAGVYGERQGAAVGAAFDKLFRSLADSRTELLAREGDAATLSATYEFPREFRKVRGVIVQFLVDLCRPSQLTTAPFLRGFYFSGVRPVAVNEAAPAAPAAAEPAGFGSAADATGIFQAGQRQRPRSRSAPLARIVLMAFSQPSVPRHHPAGSHRSGHEFIQHAHQLRAPDHAGLRRRPVLPSRRMFFCLLVGESKPGSARG
jgi:hypothetical protein